MENLSDNGRCETWEEEMYWRHFHVMHFYQVLPNDFLDHLVLPSKFIEHVPSKLANKVFLLGPSNSAWEVEISKNVSPALVGDGWKDFARAYNLEENILLLFKYKQNSTFEVLIFDQENLCEKEFSYFVRKSLLKPDRRIVRKRSLGEVTSTEVMEDNDDGGGGGSERILSKKLKKCSTVPGRRNNPEPPTDASSCRYKKMEELSRSCKCKTWEEDMYWKHFHAMHFYQVLPKNFNDQLVLPSKFAEHVSYSLPNKVSLIGPSGFAWYVEVSKTGSLALTGDGWKDFAMTYNLEENFLMMFKYKQNSCFEALIFDKKTLCEKESCYFVKKCSGKPDHRIDGKRSVVEVASTEIMEDSDDGGGSECVPSNTPKEGASGLGHRNKPEASRTCLSDESSEDNHNDPEVISDKAIAVEVISSGERTRPQCSRSCVSNEVAAQSGAGPSKASKSKGLSAKKVSVDAIAKKLSLPKEKGHVPAENGEKGHVPAENGEKGHVPAENGEKGLLGKVILTTDNSCTILSDTLSAEEMNEDGPPVICYSRKSVGKRDRPGKRSLVKSAKKLFRSASSRSPSTRTKRLSKEYKSQRRPVTTEEKEEALRRANEAFTEGSFMVTMPPTGVYKRFYLNIPKDWMQKHLPQRHHEVILRVGEKTWVTMFHYYTHRGSSGGIATGWKNFAIQNNLEDSDVCIFKPASQEDGAAFILDVQIFRVVEETTPLTPLICSM